MQEYNNINFDDIEYNDIEFDEELLQEKLFFAKEEYEQWSRDMDTARCYAMNMDELNNENIENVHKMREIVGENDHKLISLLDEKEELLNKMRQDNIEFIEKIDRDYKPTEAKHEEKIQGIYEKLRTCH